MSGASLERTTWLLDDLRHENITVDVFSVADEPTVETVRAGLAVARRASLSRRGSDCARWQLGDRRRQGDWRACAGRWGRAGLSGSRGAERALSAAPLPIIAIPTTAGPGAEVTRNAVLGAPEHGVKVSLRDDRLLPALALVDPTLTLSLSPRLTAETGLDAITQLIEPYLSPFSTPITDAFCREGIPKALHALPRAIARPSDLAARSDMALASLLGGLASAKLGAVHGLAGVIGGRTGGAHGAICGRLLPHVLMLNVRALRDRDPANPARRRLDEVAGWIADAHDSTLDEAFEFLESRVDLLGVARLGAIGIKWGAFCDVAGKSTRASSMRGNPIELTEDELVQVLTYAH